MLTKDATTVMRAVATVVREYVNLALNPLGDRLNAIEHRLVSIKDGAEGPRGPAGEDGADGKDADMALVIAATADMAALRAEWATFKAWQAGLVSDAIASVGAEVEKAVAAIPPAKDGAPGQSVDMADVEALVAKAVDAIPRPQDGHTVTIEELSPVVTEAVTKAVEALPKPKDPVGMVGAMIDRSGHLFVTLSDGSSKDVGMVVGHDGKDVNLDDLERFVAQEVAKIPPPKDGAPGRDGTLENLKVHQIDERTFEWQFKDGTPVEGGLVKTPVVLYRGLFDAEASYEAGDTVTWGGSMWTAKQDSRGVTPDELTPASKAIWALAVMRGRQGKSGAQGLPGPIGKQGPQGPQGRNGY